MLFLLFTASLFWVSPCFCEVHTCVYGLLVAKIRECGVLASPVFHYSFVFLFPACLLCCSVFFVCFCPSPSFYGNEHSLLLGTCQSGPAHFAPPFSIRNLFGKKKETESNKYSVSKSSSYSATQIRCLML